MTINRPRFATKLSTRFFITLIAATLVASALGVTAYMQGRKQKLADEPAKPAEIISLKNRPSEVKKDGEATTEGMGETQEAVLAPEAVTTTSYPFTATSGVPLEDMSSGTATLVAANLDDNASAVTNIGFDYWYDGVRFTQFSVNANGLCRLGSTAVSTSFDNSTDFNATTNAPKIAPYFDDLWTGTNGKVHFKVIGSAPNRKLIVEWQNEQIPRVAAGNVGAGTFQMWLFETTGIIEFVYGSGVALNSANGGYSIGLQSGAATNFASVTTSTNTVSYAAANNTQTNAITAGTAYIFTPNVPAAPTGLSFTGVTSSAMTLNWTDNATNEVGNAIYQSTDNVNFTFVTQTAANATSQAISGLTPSTTYFFKVFAVTEGALSSALTGSQATAAPTNIMSTAVGGNWSSTLTWVGGVVPTINDNVTIADAATVTIDTAANALSLNVGTGLIAPTTLQYEATTARTLTVATNVTIASNGIFQSAATGTQIGHVLSVGGNLTNNGVLDFSTTATNVAGAGITFTGAANNTFGGTGATTDVRTITINKGTSNANVLELNPTNFTARGTTTDSTSAAYLTLTNGTFKISGTFTAAFRTFTAAGYTIGATTGFWLNNSNYTVSGQNGSPTNSGLLRLTQGTYNVGTASGNSISGTTGIYNIEGGTLNVAGRLQLGSSATYTQSGGTVNVSTVGNASASFASFDALSTAVLNLSGGTINLVQATINATPFDWWVDGTINFSGAGTTVNVGTGATTTNFNFRLRGNLPNLVVDNTTNNKTATVVAQTNVIGNTTVSPGTTLNLNGFVFVPVGANLFNNGTISGNTAGSRLYFAGANPQQYGGSGVAGTNALPLQSVDFDSTGGVTFQSGTVNNLITNRINMFRGNVTNSNKITLGIGGTSTGVIQMGVAAATAPAGSFDVAPTFNLGSGGQIMIYAQETTGRTTGVEINPARSLTRMSLDNTNGLTIAGGDISLTSALATANNEALALANGKITTDANVVALTSGTGTVARTNGYVIGNLRKNYTATGSKTFEVGTANGYSPVAANVTAGTGNFTVKATQGKLPQVSGTNALARYWTLTGTGLTANLTFTYLATDVTGTVANYVFIKNSGGVLSSLAPTGTPTSTSATINGVSSFSDWTLAEPGAILAGSLQFSSATYSDNETNADHTFNVPVTRTGGSDGAVSVNYAVTDGTATIADNDYSVSPATGTLNWAAGDTTSKNIVITIKGDTTIEPNETVNLTLSTPQGAGATLGSPATATLTITNDDLAPANVVYVDDDFTGPAGSDPDGGGPATSIGYDAFATIQGGVTGVASGGTVNVAAGTYTENVTIAKPLTLTGADAATVTQRPALSGPNPCAGSSLCAGASNLILVQADNVTISGLTLDGDNPALTSGVVRGGADLDARNGIITNHTVGTFTNLTVHHATIKNIYLRGVYNSAGGTFNIHHNTVQNVQGEGASIGLFNFGGGGTFDNNNVSDCNDAIASNHSKGVQFTNNTVTTSASGIHTDNAGDQAGSTSDTISNNTVTNSQQFGFGIWTFVPTLPIMVTNNTVTNVEVGLSAAGGNSTPVASTFAGNTVDGQNRANSTGVYLTTDQFGFGQGNNLVVFRSNTVKNNVDGFFLEANDTPNIHQAAKQHKLPVASNVSDGESKFAPRSKQTAAPAVAFTLTVNADFNRVAGNTSTGISKVGAGTLALNFENNWWGCNAGPNQTGCQTVAAGVDFDPWLVLTVTAAPNPIAPGGTSTITADMTHNSDNAVPSSTVFLPPTPITFAATQGNVSPTSGTTANGTATTTFTSTSASSGTASATADNQTTSTNVNVTAPSFTIDDVTHNEGNSGTTAYTFTVTKTGSTAFSSSVDFTTVDGTATVANNDYALNSGTLNFGAADTAMQLTVLVNGDTTLEPDEAFTVHLSNANGATITDADGTGTITNDDQPPPPVVYVDDDWTGLPNGTDPDGAGPATSIGYDAFAKVQDGVSGVASGGTVNVYAGTYDEDVAITNNGLKLLGAGAANTTIRGAIGGGDVSTIHLFSSNVTIAGFTITRVGNNTTDWNNPGLNTAGIAIQGLSITGTLVRDNVITGNRTGLDINNSNGHTVRNNSITFNRTGFIFRNQTDNMTVVENFITDNWTVGVLFLDGSSGGSNVPAQSATHSIFNNNDLSANWYGQIVDRQSGGSLPAPGTTNLKNFRGNWLGTTSPVVTTANSAEPGYAAQIPTAYGGSATAPGNQPDIAGPASANIKYIPFLLSGTDTNVETTPGRGTNGFQGVQNTVTVWPPNQNGWVFFNDSPGVGTGSGGFTHGPATPPLGVGSAFLTVDSQARHALGTGAYAGTRMDDVTELRYSSYQNNNTDTNLAPSLQFDIDYDLTDTNTAYHGRLVFEPYQIPATVQQNVWQQWDAYGTGKWYGTRSTVIINGNMSVPNPCQQNTPCTWQQVLASFPNAGMFNGGALLFKAGGPWAGGFNGNVDAFQISVNTARTTYDFEPSPQLSIDDVTHNEGNAGQTAYTFTVTLSRAVDVPVTVDYATADNTATAPSDYTAITTTQLMFNPGDTSKQVTVQVNGDTMFEANEQFFVNLTNPSNATILDGQGIGTITNDDAAQNGTLQFSAANYNVNESQPTATITVTRTGGTDGAVSVDYATSDNTANAPADYTFSGGTLNWADGDAAPKTFTVVINNDALTEPNEIVNLTLSNPQGGATLGAQSTATLTIQDNDAAPTVKVIRPGGLQGWTQQHAHCNGGTSTGSQAFVYGPAPVPVGDGSLQYLIGADGDSFETIRNPDLNNTSLNALTNLSYSTFVQQTGAGGQAAYLLLNIDNDNDGTLDDQLFFEPVYQNGTYTKIFPDDTIPNQCGANTGCVATAQWQTWDALAGGWWSANESAGGPPLITLRRYAVEHPNARIVNTDTGAGGFRIATGCGGSAWPNFDGNADNVLVGVNNANTLYDLEPLPQLTIDDVTHNEGDSGTTAYTFTVTLARASDQTVTVDYATANDTATAPSDYTAVPTATLTFDPGQTTKTITVQVNGDILFEPTEQFFVNLTNASGATILDGQGVGTITNDDAPAVGISISDAFVAEPSAGTATAQFTVSLSGPQTSPVTVDYATMDGTATAPDDYTAIPTTQLTFMPGQTTRTINVTVNSDALAEGSETFFVNLSNPSVNATITDGTGQGTITDPLAAGQMLISEFRFRGETFSAPQGIGGERDEFVELYNNTNQPVVVATTDGSQGWTIAAIGSDGTTVNALVVIPAGTIIPARGHFLAINSDEDTTTARPNGNIVPEGGYSLNSYAVGDAFYVTDVPDASGVALFSTANVAAFSTATRLDAAGFNANPGSNADLYREGPGLVSPGAVDGQYAFVRRMETGLPQDTDSNTADFVFVAPGGALYGSVQSILGAPGPENCGCMPNNTFAGSSPIQRNATVKASVIEPQVVSTAPPNRIRDTNATGPNAALGTLEIRRRFKNSTGQTITRLRFRVVDVTTLNSPNPGGTQADIRWLSSSDMPVTTSLGSLTLRGTVIETPPAQGMGGGLNSTGTVAIPMGTLAPGASIDVRFVLGVQQGGRFRFFVNVEALP